MAQDIHVCARCGQPITTTGVVSSGRAVHTPSCPAIKRSKD